MANLYNIKWNNLNRVLNQLGDYFIQEARTNLGKNRSYASGTLGDTLEKIVEIDGVHFSVSVRIQDYWEYVEKGRRPGKFPPPTRLMEWILVKPVHPKADKNGRVPTVKQLSYLIGRKIATQGIPPRPFFKPAQKDTIKHFEKAIVLAIDEDIAEYVQEHVINKALYQDLMKFL